MNIAQQPSPAVYASGEGNNVAVYERIGITKLILYTRQYPDPTMSGLPRAAECGEADMVGGTRRRNR